MFSPTEEGWVDRFIRRPPQLMLRISDGMDGEGALYVDGRLIAGGVVNELTDRAQREFNLKSGDTFTIEFVKAGKVATVRLRTPAERAAGVRVCVAIEPLNEETDQ